jgi:copper chaperone CopZ
MAEEKKKEKPSKADGGDKKTEAIVLKVDLHCAGCASKVKRAIKHAPGVESVKTDTAANKVVVTGAADAADLKERIEARAKKPVQIVSAGAGPPPKKENKESEKEKEKKADGGEKKPEKDKGKQEKEKGKPEKEKKAQAADKPKEEEKKPKEPKEETVTLKIRLHCVGCIDRIKRRVLKIKGVKGVEVDAAKDLVKVTGTMDAAALPGYLRDKLRRPVEVVAPSKKDGGDKKDDGEKKKDKGAGDGGEKKKDAGGSEDKKDKSAAASASVAPMPMADASMYQMPPQYGYHMPYNAAPAPSGYYGAAAPPPNPAFYPNAGPYYPPPYASYPAHAPQIFSDENPNACSVM